VPDDDGTDAGDRKLLDDIERVGWHMIGVPEDDRGPGFVYSIRLFHSFRHPEIVVVGMKLQLMFSMVSEVGTWARSGQPVRDGTIREGLLEDYTCTFRSVGKQWYKVYFGYALWFYQSDDFPVLQCVWPDKDERWPWDPQFNPPWKPKQPVLE
jgi:hypothetical protein